MVDTMITCEQKTALEDIVVNIISPVISWLSLYDAEPTLPVRLRLREICLEAERKVREFKCDNHCFYGAICREYNRKLANSSSDMKD